MANVTAIVLSGARFVEKTSADVLPSPAIGSATGQTTSSTSEVSLTTITLPAGTLAVNGQMIRITYYGRTTGVGTCTPRIKFGATYVDPNVPVTAPTSWATQYIVVRTGATAQRTHGSQLVDSVLPLLKTATPGETLSGDVTIDFRGVVSLGTATLIVDAVLVEYWA